MPARWHHQEMKMRLFSQQGTQGKSDNMQVRQYSRPKGTTREFAPVTSATIELLYRICQLPEGEMLKYLCRPWST